MADNINFNSIFSNPNATFDFGSLLSEFAANSGLHGQEEDDDHDWKSAYLSLKDDFDSYRKRIENARNIEKFNLTKEIVKGFLDVVEYLIFIYKAKNEMGTYTKEDEMVLNKITEMLKKYDVHPMLDPVGKPFDHKYHEAVMSDKSGMFESGTVTLLLEHGYMIGDEVLKYAKVVVAT